MLGSPFWRLTPFERLLSLVTSVRPGEGRIVALMLAQVFLLLHGYYLIRPVRESLILTEGSPEIRAYAAGAIAVTLLFLIPLYKLLFDRVDGGRDKSAILSWIALFFISNLLIFAFLAWIGVPVAVPFYIWVGIFSVMVVAQFWAFAADLFNIKTGQRLFAVIMVGAALGAATGSQVGGYLHAAVGTANLMLVAAAFLAAVVVIGRYAQRNVPPGSSSTSGAAPADAGGGLTELLGGFRLLANSRYLLLIAAFVLLVNWINSTGGYILATFVSEHAAAVTAVPGGELTRERVFDRFYGDYYAAIALLQLAAQLFLVSRLYRWIGVRGALLVLPLVMLANYGLVALVPVFALVRVLMIIETSTTYSIHMTTNHALYLPVTREEKYVGKTTIDTFVWRFGDLIYAATVFVSAQVLGFTVSAVIYLNVALALVLLWTGSAIGHSHRARARRDLDNLPPVQKIPLPDVFIPSGQTLTFSIPEDAFVDPDPGDTVNIHALRADGGPLPPWMQFDSFNQVFTTRPPPGTEGRVEVRVTATDFEGLTVEAGFDLTYGPGTTPHFTAPEAATPPARPTR